MIERECDTMIIGGGSTRAKLMRLIRERRRRAMVLKAGYDLRTCRIGAPADPGTGLRVIDSSIMPEAPRTITHLATVAVAQRVTGSLKATS